MLHHNNKCALMSQLGQQATWARVRLAPHSWNVRHVRFVPKADIAGRTKLIECAVVIHIIQGRLRAVQETQACANIPPPSWLHVRLWSTCSILCGPSAKCTAC